VDSFGVSATATTAVPGAIWMEAGEGSAGLPADLCADDAGNGNAGAIAQSYQCNGDLAQYWVQSSNERLARNGVCLTQSGSTVSLKTCAATNDAQQWDVRGTNGQFGGVVNAASGDCLTAKAENFAQLTAGACTGSADQQWTGPAKSAA
jgi:hypothetical protein